MAGKDLTTMEFMNDSHGPCSGIRKLSVREETYLGRELRQFVGLSVNPSQRLHIFKMIVLWQISGQIDRLMGTPLRRQNDTTDLLDLRIVAGTDAVHVAGNLRPQIRYADELLQHVLGQNVGVAGLFDIIGRHIDVLCP